jgi:NAD(P)-dependent dehydrogenase (short-subunit alcohol dehydrogenase family)
MKSSHDLFRLRNKVALVTGGGGIVGRPIVAALAEAGATVVMASRDRKKCLAVAARMRSRGHRVWGERLDLSSDSELRALRERILSRYRRLDILFNNAVARATENFYEMTAEHWEQSMKVNATGVFMACKIFSELMKSQESGSIVNVASIYGVVAPHFPIYVGTTVGCPPDYAFAKGGLIALTRYLASMLGPYNIRVNCLSPGGVVTSSTTRKFRERYSRRTLLRRMAKLEDLKGPAVFLASDASRYITGQNLLVDGGWTAI